MIKNDEKKMMIKDDKKKITTTYYLRLKDLIVKLRKKSVLRCNSTSHLVIGSKFSTNESKPKPIARDLSHTLSELPHACTY